MENIVSFELETNQTINFDDYDNDEFAIARMGFLASRPNSHGLEISDEVLKECASTVLGKWVVSKYNFAKNDFEGHEPSEQIMGVVPKDQEVEFVEEEEYLRAYVNVVISKIYAKEFCDILNRDESHAVSVEMSVVTENGNTVNDVVNSFNIVGVTVLGTTVRPSVPDSDIEFVRFAENAETYFEEKHLTASQKNEQTKTNMTEESVIDKIEFEKERKEGESRMEIEFAAVNIGELWSNLYNAIGEKNQGAYYSIKDIYEENNQKFALVQKYGDEALYRLDFSLTEDGITLSDEIVKVQIEVVETDEVVKFAEPEDVEKYRTFAKEEDKEDTEAKSEDEEKKDDEAKMEEIEVPVEEAKLEEVSEEVVEEVEMSAEEMKAKIAQLESVIQERDSAIMDRDVELEELREFKKTCMEAERASKVETVMSSVANYMDEKTSAQYREKGLNCEFSEVDAWANEVKAFAFDKEPIKKTKKNTEEITRMSAPVITEKKKANTAFGRLKEKFQD